MCLMLYMAAGRPIPHQSTPSLTVENVPSERQAIQQWLSLPTIRFVGAHTGCSCGFPSVRGEQPIEYYDGLFDNSEDREKDLASIRNLLELIVQTLQSCPLIGLLPVWAGDESEPPAGTIEMKASEMTPESFLLNERYLHRITR